MESRSSPSRRSRYWLLSLGPSFLFIPLILHDFSASAVNSPSWPFPPEVTFLLVWLYEFIVSFLTFTHRPNQDTSRFKKAFLMSLLLTVGNAVIITVVVFAGCIVKIGRI